MFFDAPSAILRIRLKDGAWVGGLFGRNSYAAGYPEEPQDLYLERTYRVDGDGNFEVTGPRGESFVEVGSGLLVRWDEIKHVEFFESEEA